MIYISMNYYLLVLAVLIIYYVLPIKTRWIAILGGNLGFYFLFYKTGWWILGITIFISYISGILLQLTEGKKKKCLLIFSILTTLTPWFLIKNFNFLLEITTHKNPIDWVVPLGISFYTLQLISYLVDVYNKKIVAEKNFAYFILFTTFFPQLIQGPIPRYGQLQEQLITGHRFDEYNIIKGFNYILWGFFLKLMIADKAGIVVNTVFDNYPAYSGIYIWLASILYSIQLYTDFLACTTLAQGVSRMFGINLMDNFARPYFATSIKDFWRRWHISLSSWLRDYIYIPLGGNRNGKFKKYLYLAITFFVSGLWHGAGYKFLIWGMMHASFQIIGEFTYQTRERIYSLFHISTDSNKKRIVKQIGTFLLVNWAWIIFRADSLQLGIRMIKHMFEEFNPWILFNDQIFSLGLVWKETLVLLLSIVLFWKIERIHEEGQSISDSIMIQRLPIRWGIYLIAIIGVMILGTYGFGFNAQDFIYGGF